MYILYVYVYNCIYMNVYIHIAYICIHTIYVVYTNWNIGGTVGALLFAGRGRASNPRAAQHLVAHRVLTGAGVQQRGPGRQQARRVLHRDGELHVVPGLQAGGGSRQGGPRRPSGPQQRCMATTNSGGGQHAAGHNKRPAGRGWSAWCRSWGPHTPPRAVWAREAAVAAGRHPPGIGRTRAGRDGKKGGTFGSPLAGLLSLMGILPLCLPCLRPVKRRFGVEATACGCGGYGLAASHAFSRLATGVERELQQPSPRVVRGSPRPEAPREERVPATTLARTVATSLTKTSACVLWPPTRLRRQPGPPQSGTGLAPSRTRSTASRGRTPGRRHTAAGPRRGDRAGAGPPSGRWAGHCPLRRAWRAEEGGMGNQ